MAKSRVTTNPMYTGGAGGYSFYVRKGEQVIRQRKNNSNYGSGASRTYAQMIRRVKWGNLVNVFKAMKSWQPKAYDSKKQGQTDYNIFMQLNINNATAALTREMCISGCAVIEPLQVSRGSLPPIALTLAGSGNQYVSDIVISNAITGSTTVGQLSADIIANNPQFQEGDNLAFCFFLNWKDSRVEWPFVTTKYAEITLDTASSVVISTIASIDSRLSKATGGTLQVSWPTGFPSNPNNEVGMVLIHTRKSASMLAVSSQVIVMNGNSILSDFSGNTWYQTCINSYGLTDEVPLDPSFPEASISSVTANGSAVSEGSTLEGSQTVRISGTNLNTKSVKLTFDGVEYVPLNRGVDFMEYVIGDNGSVRITLNGHVYLNFSVEGITPPAELPVRMSLWRTAGTAASTSADTPQIKEELSTDCLQVPLGYFEEKPNYIFKIGILSLDLERVTYHNCAYETTRQETVTTNICVSITNPDDVAYIELDGFIVCVFNYTI